MLRRLPFRRDLPIAAERGTDGGSGMLASPVIAEAAGGPSGAAVTTPGRRLTPGRVALGVAVFLVLAMGVAYTQKDRYSDDAADLSRRILGDERTAQMEGRYFRLQDRVDQLKYRVIGGDENPFAERAVVQFVTPGPAAVVLVDVRRNAQSSRIEEVEFTTPILPPRPLPMTLPKVTALRDNPEAGEGEWTTAGLPRSSPTDILMARTFVRPDKARPYATVGLLLLDERRIRLDMVGGTLDPGGDRGVKGAGVIPTTSQTNLLVAWNGGFKGPHGNFGMVANGVTYRPLRNGLASVAVLKDGTIQIGEWGRTLSWSDEMAAVRQNAVLLVEDCKVSKRTAEGNDTWGYVAVNSAEFITWRSAVGLTKEGNLLVAAGNSLSAATLATAMQAAGACTAMQLDINSPYVLTSLVFPQPDGSLQAQKFMESMPDNPARFFKTQERDFMWVTLDESRYK